MSTIDLDTRFTLTRKEVALALGFGSVKKVDRLRRDGILKGFMLDGTRLFSVQEIRDMIAQREADAGGAA